MNIKKSKLLKYLGVFVFLLSLMANIRAFSVINTMSNDMHSIIEKNYNANVTLRELLDTGETSKAKIQLDEQIKLQSLLLFIQKQTFFK